MTTAIQPIRPQGAMIAPAAPLSFNEMLQMAQAFAASGFFRDSQDANKCIVKMQYGAELGIGPAASMMGVHVIEGKPAPSSNLMATLIKRHPRYNFRIVVATALVCELECFDGGQSLGKVGFSWEDAERIKDKDGNPLANKANWRNYPADMLFARAVSRAARYHFADVFGGAPVYSAEELGAEVTIDSQGEMVVVDAVQAPKPQRTGTPAPPQAPGRSEKPQDAPQPPPVATGAPVVLVGDEIELNLVKKEIRRVRDSYSWTNAELLKVIRAHVNPDLDTLQDATLAECQQLLDVLKEKNLGALPEYASIINQPAGAA